MSFKLGTTNNRAILINEDSYYDLEQISNGSVSSDSVQADSRDCSWSMLSTAAEP